MRTKRRLSEDLDANSQDPLEKLLTSEFKNLRNVITEFDNKLNTMAAQVNRVELNEAWPNYKFDKSRDQHEYDTLCAIGKELDLALESQNATNAVNHITSAREFVEDRLVTLRVAEGYGWDVAAAIPSTQDKLLKGKESLIEKAKVLAEAKKSKRRKIDDTTERSTQSYGRDGYQGQNSNTSANRYQTNYGQFFRSGYQARNWGSRNKCYICGGSGHFANTCSSDPYKNSGQDFTFRSRGYTAYRDRYSKPNEDNKRD